MVEPPLGWHRLDLVRAAPAVEVNHHDARPPFEAGIGFLGLEEVRDMSRVPRRHLQAFPVRRAPQIRVLEQAVGTRLAWEVELGEAPYASFRPLGWRGEECGCRFRFGLRDARGQIHELHREVATEVPGTPSGAVEVDLSDFAASRVEILLQVDRVPGAPRPAGATVAAGEEPALLWGSPAIYHRRPVDDWRPGPPERPNVLLLGLDTLRADHVGPWRGEDDLSPSLTPAIDRLAEESDVWLKAFSTFSNTNPSFASIMTGLYGKDHGVYDLKTPLPPAHETLAEVFSEAGYETLAVISASHLGDHNSGLGQGFDRVHLAEHTFAGELPVETAMDWIAERPERAGGAAPPPFFAWLHLFDPHTPHTPTAPYAVGFRPARPVGLRPVGSWIPFRRPGSRSFDEPVLGGRSELYAGEVAYLDRQVDRLLGFLESRRLLERTVVVLVADHGENLGEYGIDYRHVGLWDTTTHVPLLVRRPGAPGEGEGRRFDGLVQTLDLFPTLLAAAGLQVPDQDGTELDLLTGEGRRGRRAVFAEHADRTGAMVRTATHKYIRMAGAPFVPDGVYLYKVARDPEEERNLAGQGLPVEAELAGLLERFLRQRRQGPEAESRALSEEERRKLEALGYVQ